MNYLTAILPPFRYGLAGYICGTYHIRCVPGRQEFFSFLLDLRKIECYHKGS